MRQHIVLMLGLVAAASAASLTGMIGMTDAQEGYTETVYAPGVMVDLADRISDGTTSETTVLGDDTVVRVDTTVTIAGSAHTIAYRVYVDGVYDSMQSNTVMVMMLADDLYHVVDDTRNVLLTSDSFTNADRSVERRDRIQCIANPYVVGHNRATDPTNCWMQGTGTVDIKPTTGKVAWVAPETIYYWFNTYVRDGDSKINPTFAGTYYSNCGSCSLSFDGIYLEHSAYTATVTHFYS